MFGRSMGDEYEPTVTYTRMSRGGSGLFFLQNCRLINTVCVCVCMCEEREREGMWKCMIETPTLQVCVSRI